MLEPQKNVQTVNMKARNGCMGEGPTALCDNLCVEVDKDSNDSKDDFYSDEHDDNLLKTFRVSTRHGLLQELQHVLQNLDSCVE